jgi:hypothetical protein
MWPRGESSPDAHDKFPYESEAWIRAARKAADRSASLFPRFATGVPVAWANAAD